MLEGKEEDWVLEARKMAKRADERVELMDDPFRQGLALGKSWGIRIALELRAKGNLKLSNPINTERWADNYDI